MANILVNGLKSKTGGGRSILSNYIELLFNDNSKNTYFVLTPDKALYDKYSNHYIQIIDVSGIFKKNILFPLLYAYIFPKIIKKNKIDSIFNLGDIVIPSKLPQLYLFDWSYAVNPESIIWKRMDFKGYFNRKIKLMMFKKYVKHATRIIAQTETMKKRLERIYKLRNIEVIPNAVALENFNTVVDYDFKLSNDKTKFLYPTYYYSHKNLEILIPLAIKIKERNLPYCIIITIDPFQNKLSEKLISNIKKFKLESIIVNVGHQEMGKIPSLYRQSDALLMPTLLESYGLPYVEAMFHNKTILTSDLDFATDICGDAAYYFDPLNVNSILSSIINAFSNEDERNRKLVVGRNNIAKLPEWSQVFERYQEQINEISRN